jgi:predicted helicase
LSGTTHNVFEIQVGVSINLLIRQRSSPSAIKGLYYARTDEWWRKEKKYEFLDSASGRSGVTWKQLIPDENQNWITEGFRKEFGDYMPLGDKPQNNPVFGKFSNGVKTNRDAWVYNFRVSELSANVRRMIDTYNEHVSRWGRGPKVLGGLDDFVSTDDHEISWSGDLKAALARGEFAAFEEKRIRLALYRPFDRKFIYFDRLLNNSVYQIPRIFPTTDSELENAVIALTGPGSEKPFVAMAARYVVDLHLTGAGCTTQCFPFYTYDEDGSNRRENITDWALNEFRTYYSDTNITKWDIFHYVYAVLHHPEYRERYAANLKRELPRIPFVGASVAPLSEGAGLQASGKDSACITSALPKASAEPTAERHEETAGPSTRAEALARDDNGVGGDRGPSTPAAQPQAASAQDDKQIFWAFANADGRLADLHVNYEQQPAYPLERVEKGQLNWRVEKMRPARTRPRSATTSSSPCAASRPRPTNTASATARR